MTPFAPPAPSLPLRLRASVHRAEAAPGDPAPYAGEDSFTFVRVSVTDAEGALGHGFTGRFCAAEVAHLLNGAVAEALSRRGPMPDLARVLNPRGMTGVVVSALSALDIALWDLAGQRAGKSVAALLGGARPSAPVDVTCGFPALDTDALVAACAQEVAAGAHGVKVLVAARGRSPAEDLARVAAVRAAIGEGAALIADANCGWDPESALAFARGAAALNLSFLEEPVRGNDRKALAALAAEGIVPLGAGQMEQSADRFALLAEAGVRVIQPNAVFAGGIPAAIGAARAAEAAGCTVSPAGGWDIVNLHWMCGAMTSGAVELHRAQARIARLLMPEPPRLRDGVLAVSDAPGLGLRPDEDALAACRVGP
ncbi:mandelate racemase/muconate lactonizing enzyme family protein [Rhodobacterales bacterium HKCCSP123]|nr:mandelate racemase/muconate lactonizing enzyme family protein [Rhodobacterales bacterium HKCCSP123]